MYLRYMLRFGNELILKVKKRMCQKCLVSGVGKVHGSRCLQLRNEIMGFAGGTVNPPANAGDMGSRRSHMSQCN